MPPHKVGRPLKSWLSKAKYRDHFYVNGWLDPDWIALKVRVTRALDPLFSDVPAEDRAVWLHGWYFVRTEHLSLFDPATVEVRRLPTEDEWLAASLHIDTDSSFDASIKELLDRGRRFRPHAHEEYLLGVAVALRPKQLDAAFRRTYLRRVAHGLRRRYL